MTELIGIDIGGSKTHGVLFKDGQPVREATAGSANVQNVSVAEAAAALKELFSQLKPTGVTPVIAGAGGIDTPSDEQALRNLLRFYAPEARIDVIHDSRLILAAAGVQEGVAVIAGTGSVAWGRSSDGMEARRGGWGYLLGDEGSGYWVGRAAVRHALRLLDEHRNPDRLTASLLRSTRLDNPAALIAMFHSPDHGRNFWAKQSRCVTELAATGEAASIELLSQSGRDLAWLAKETAGQLGIKGPIILGGGLGINCPTLQRAFSHTLTSEGLGPVEVLGCPPAYGALYLAVD